MGRPDDGGAPEPHGQAQGSGQAGEGAGAVHGGTEGEGEAGKAAKWAGVDVEIDDVVAVARHAQGWEVAKYIATRVAAVRQVKPVLSAELEGIVADWVWEKFTAAAVDAARASMECRPTTAEICRAIGVVEKSRQTHVEWAEFQESNADWREVIRNDDPEESGVGGPDHHRHVVAEYDFVIDVLRRAR